MAGARVVTARDDETDMPTLRTATDDEKRTRDALTHPVWGGGLTVEQYLAREARLRAHPWTRAGMATWLLVDDDDRPLASCESMASRSVFDGVAGETHAIASVFTETELRGRGHAVELIAKVVDALAERERAHAVTLYSDVGARIYERAGFFAVTSLDRWFEPEPGDPADGVTPLAEADISDVAPPDARFVVWPDPTQLDWHRERERAYAELMRRPRLPLAGATAGRGSIVFAGDLKNGRLSVLRFVATSIDEADALLRCARRVAHVASLTHVVVWEDPSQARFVRGGALVPRSGGLSMIRPIARGLSPAEWAIVPKGTWV